MINKHLSPVICVANQKGGVGKTTIASLYSEYSALIRKKKVLLIDLDMQCNTTDQWVGMEKSKNAIGGQLPPRHPDYDPKYGANERSTIADIFYNIPALPYKTWLNGEIGKGGFVEVICGHPQLLEDINIQLCDKTGKLEGNLHNVLKDFLQSTDVQEEYDYIILDTGPSRSPIFRAALKAASHLIIPFTPEEKDIQGINAMLQIMRQENYSRGTNERKLNLIGLLPNKVRKIKLHDLNCLEMEKNHSSILFPKNSWLSLSTNFPERDTVGIRPKSIFEMPQSTLSRKQAILMGKFIEKQINTSTFNRNTEEYAA